MTDIDAIDINKLENDALTRAVAEALGWTNIHEDWMKLWGYNPIEGYHEPIPDYAHDLNAAIALPCERTLNISITPDGLAKANYDDLWTDLPPAIPATAVCHAWLLWQEAQTARQTEQDRRDHWRPGMA